ARRMREAAVRDRALAITRRVVAGRAVDAVALLTALEQRQAHGGTRLERIGPGRIVARNRAFRRRLKGFSVPEQRARLVGVIARLMRHLIASPQSEKCDEEGVLHGATAGWVRRSTRRGFSPIRNSRVPSGSKRRSLLKTT